MKYIIANGNQYVVNSEKTNSFGFTNSLETATRFKLVNAQQFLKVKLGDDSKWTIRKVGNFKSNKNYIITTASCFIAADGAKYTNKIQKAKIFRSIADVEAYLINNKDIFENTCILDENENTVVMPKRKQFTPEQLEELGIHSKKDCVKTKRVPIKKPIRDIVYANGGGICAICGRPVSKDDFTIDHIVPLSRGGKNEISNYQIACAKCNKLKGNSKDEEFLKSISSILTNHILDNTNSEIADQIIRSVFRSKLNNMKGAAFLQMK